MIHKDNKISDKSAAGSEGGDARSDAQALALFAPPQKKHEDSSADSALKTYSSTVVAADYEEDGVDGAGKKLRIGDHLVSRGVITADQLNVAIQEKKISGKMLG